LFLAGPLGLSRVDAGPYTNSYLSLFQLSKFSVARTPVPDFYRELADMRPDTAIVELPTLSNRSVHLYRGYYLLHGKRTMLSAVDSHGPYLPRDLYVPIRRQELLDAGVDFVVAHVDPLTEIDSYWAQVYGSPAKGFGRAYMERHERFGRRAIKPPSIIQLRKALGAPRYEDGTLIVWEIRSE
jgi:hypothetical protein